MPPSTSSLELVGVIGRGFEHNERVERNYKLACGMATLLVF